MTEKLLCGFETSDDAAVYRLTETTALVFTADFFPPIVDDPFDFGAIAAANALSDIYAMGGEPFLAINLLSYPADLGEDIVAEILRGGMEMAREASVIIAGGHTTQDREPKYGLAVIGSVHPDRVILNRGARPGDRILLTKPLGIGVITTALKGGTADSSNVAEATRRMKQLNREAARAALNSGVRAMTDVTGYGLAGHLHEMLEPDSLGADLSWQSLPFLPGARDLAEKMVFPGGAYTNQAYYSTWLEIEKDLSDGDKLLLCSPETSGGLLLAIPPESLETFRSGAGTLEFWEIGAFTDTGRIRIR